MPMGILFWVLWILCALAVFFGTVVAGINASIAVFLILFGLVGWKLFGPPLQ